MEGSLAKAKVDLTGKSETGGYTFFRLDLVVNFAVTSGSLAQW